MTFLELCQRLRREVGAAGNGPSNIAGQSGEYARLIGWVRDAWAELQAERRDWRFDWAQGGVDVVHDFREYLLPDDFDRWDAGTLRLQGKTLQVVSWAVFRERYREPAGQGPRHVAIAPDGILHLDDYPATSGEITFEYWRTPQVLESNTDTPRLPERYHMLVVYRAMLQYGLYENAPEVVQQAGINAARLLSQMELSELPTLSFAGPLA
ncbi:hypothetical protein GCM10027040_27650 [Halomonas shantousis]